MLYHTKKILFCHLTPSGICPTQVLQDTTGKLATPGYPRRYKSYSNCSWSITVPQRQTIALTFLDFELEKDYGCSSDALRVYDGKDVSANPLGLYCGGMKPFSVLSTSNHLYIRFTSDRSLNFRGFRATYKALGQGEHSHCVVTPQAPTISKGKLFLSRFKQLCIVQYGGNPHWG